MVKVFLGIHSNLSKHYQQAEEHFQKRIMLNIKKVTVLAKLFLWLGVL